MQLPDTETLVLAQDGHSLYVTLNRPESRNAMSLQMVNELMGVFDAIENEEEIRAVVLRGAGGHFCAGGDIKDMATARGKAQEASESGKDNPFFALNREFGFLITKANKAPQVVVAVLEGAVLGGGFGLACVSDVAIAEQHAQFGLPETGLGVIPAQIAPFVVERVGLTQARRLALLGERFNGEEALRLGIVHYVKEGEEELAKQLQKVLEQVKRCGPAANRKTKALMHRVGHEPMETLLDDAARDFADAVASEEGLEGTMAFVQKRLPNWAQ
ncbi:MAG: enoyl-CoA hydratase-related protein [Pseudomonadales bacterium]|nr:enoyl-CoA hydratase-related protein [Pseudomonadales bacterium]